MRIKKLEDKFFKNGDIYIPIPKITQFYGSPLFRIEMIPKYLKKRHSIRKIIIGIPHLEEQGKIAYRSIKCDTPAIDLGNAGNWNLLAFCEEHKAPFIKVYPPKGAEWLVFTNLFTSVGSDLEWRDKKNKKIKGIR